MTMELQVTPSTTLRRPRAWTASVDERTRVIAQALGELDLLHRRFRDSVATLLHLQPSEFSAFTLIGDTGEITPKCIATELHLTTGAVTAMLDRLSAAGLVERHAHPTDRRSILVQLSVEGERKRDWVYDSYATAVAGYCAVTAPEYTDSFLACVRTAGASLQNQITALTESTPPSF